MPSIKFDTIVETAKVVSGFRDIQNAVHQTAERVEKDGKSIDDVISNIQNSMNIAIGGWSIGKFVNQMMQVRGQFQQTEMAFKTMLQSEEKADALMKQLIRTAAVTPFGVEDVTEGAKQLLAFNVAAEDVNKTLIGLGDVAAGMGLNLKDLVMLYGTTIAKGKMDTMDLYQFLNRGIPIADEIAKVMGLDVTNAIKEVQKQIKAGKVTSDIFIQAMQSMTAEGSKFGGLMEAQSKTITGQISNIEDAIEQMFNDLGKSQEGVINTGLGVVSTLVENWETVGKVLMTVVAAYGAYKAAVISMIAISKAQVAWESAKAFLSLAKSITTAKDAMALFNLVSSSNVLGLVLGAVAAGVTMFNLFGNSAEDAATKTSKFTESANEASSKVESLISILKTAKEGSKVYKDTIKELSNIYDNYGIAIDKIKEDESNLVDVKQQEIDKSKELVEQIKLEATERNRANAISKANEDYNNRVDSAQQALLGKLKDYGTSSSGIAVGIQNIVSDSVIKQFDDLTQKMAGLNEHSKEYQTYLKQYNQLEASLISESEKLANAFGFTGDKTSDARKALIGYLYELRAAKKLHSEEADNINRAADATEDFGNKATSTKNRINALQKQLQGAGEDVHVLYNRVKEFMQNYSENNINFHVNFDAKIPSWMQNMNIPELGRLGKYFSALARDLANNKKSGALVNGKWMSTNDIAQRGWDYTNAANTKQTKAEEDAKKKRREKEEAEANAKKNASKAKKAAADAKKQAEDRKKAQEELNEDLKQLQQENIDTDISQMQEGTEKKIAEIKNDYAKRKAEIDKQEAEFKKKNKEAGKKASLTSAQSNALNKARDLATQEYNKKLDEVNREALTSMRDYLKEYGSLYQQKQAIAEEYEEKIAKAQTEGEKKTLQQEKKKALANFDYESISMGIDWKGLMSGVGNMSKEMLKPMLEKLDAYTNTDKFQQADAQTQQKVVDLMQEIRTYLGTDQNATWQNLAASITSFNQSILEYQTAVKNEELWNAKLANAEKDLKNGNITQEAFDKIKKSSDDASQAVVDTKNKMNTFGIKLNSATEAVTNYTSGLTAALNKLGTWKGNEGFSEVQSAVGNIDALKGALDESLSTMGNGVAKTMGATISKGLGSTLGTIGDGITNMMGSALGSIVGVVAQIPKLILNLASSIKSFVTGILDSFTQLLQFEWLSDLVDSILASVGNLIDAIFDLPENLFKALESIVVNGVGGLLDNVLGRVGNILSLGALSSKGPSDWFTNSNAEKVQKTIDRLTDSNERLQKSIDKLKDTMTGTYGKESTNAYKEAKRQQETYNHNVMEIAKQQMSYHGSHHSWSSYWSGFNDEQLAKIRQNVKSDFNGDITTLTPEEMKKLLSYQDLVDKIRGTGKHYKGRSAYGESVLDKLEDYADLAGNLDELTEQWRESITQISFDSMKDNFISNLMDMSKSAQDFSDDFAEMMQKALLSYSMEDLMNGKLKKLYEDWADAIDAANGDSSKIDIEAFNKRYDDIVQEGLKRRDDWAKVTGYTGSSSSSQTATSGGWASMGQDTADELNGRFTALQIAGESIAQNMTTTISQMESIVTLGISTNGAVLEIRNMMIMTNSYLEDIVKYSKLTYNDFGTKLDDMNRRLKDI
jgi:DNA repair exonuclease SbcCD ATPase subunit|nr:MAG TPA: tail tape measure protein [Caudoviricetes sp.]